MAVAEELGVTKRRIQQPYAELRKTGTIRATKRPERRQYKITAVERRLVLQVHKEAR